jgi:large subunit ribosomal protein L9
MKVVFLEEVEGTAAPGDIKNVAAGFARNYLLPRKLAAPATDHYINIAKAKATKHARRQDRLDEETRTHILPKVDGRTVHIEVRIGEQGKLFGSVTARDIAEALHADTGVEIGHQQVALGQAIREIGSQDVNVRLTKNVIAKVTVSVEPLGGAVEAEAVQAEPVAAEAEAVAEEAPAEAEPETAEAAEEEGQAEAEEEKIEETGETN